MKRKRNNQNSHELLKEQIKEYIGNHKIDIIIQEKDINIVGRLKDLLDFLNILLEGNVIKNVYLKKYYIDKNNHYFEEYIDKDKTIKIDKRNSFWTVFRKIVTTTENFFYLTNQLLTITISQNKIIIQSSFPIQDNGESKENVYFSFETKSTNLQEKIIHIYQDSQNN